MRDKFSNVKDSSISMKASSMVLLNNYDNGLYVGIVRSSLNDQETGELRYLVEVRHTTDVILTNCRMLRRHGGAFNYEDYVMQQYNTSSSSQLVTALEAKPGDVVLVGQFGGQGREGVILGSLTHPARKTILDATKGPQYLSEFNGIETSINTDGEYTVTFKGQPTNLSLLSSVPSQAIAAPEYDKSVGTSFYKWDKTGSYTISDNAKKKPQTWKIDKPAGITTFLSGNISIKLDKNDESVKLISKTYDATVENLISSETKAFTVTASEKINLQSPKVAIGTKQIELLNQLSQLIDALGKVIPISPIGPCTELDTTVAWPAVIAIQTKIKTITGSF